MIKRLLTPLIAAVIIMAMVVPGCGEGGIAPLEYDLTMAVNDPDGGTTTPAVGSVSALEAGATVTVTAAPEDDYYFTGWTATAGSFASAISTTTQFTMPNSDATVTANFLPLRATGPWLDEVVLFVQPDESASIGMLKTNVVDLVATTMTDPDLLAEVIADPNLRFTEHAGGFSNLQFNPAGPVFDDDKLNPFHYWEMREAMQWLIDRAYVKDEIYQGAAVEKFTMLNPSYPDALINYPDLVADVETLYEADLAAAWAAIETAMLAINADPAVPGTVSWIPDASPVNAWDGMWWYEDVAAVPPIDEQVVIKLLIRLDDPQRDEIGTYVSGMLQTVGFDVEEIRRDMEGASAIWDEMDPMEGGYHIYTAGWAILGFFADEGWMFRYFYSPWASWLSQQLAYINNDPWPGFETAMEDLFVGNFENMTERKAMFEIVMPAHMQSNANLMLVQQSSYNPMRANVRVASDIAGGVTGSYMWALTASFVGSDPILGGTLRVAVEQMFVQPWNPVHGTNALWDNFPLRATGDLGLAYDTRDGQRWPWRIEKAEVTLQEDFPVSVPPAYLGHDWLTINMVPDKVAVPDGAWAGWDAATGTFYTAEERADPLSPFYDGTYVQSANRKSVVYYPTTIFDHPLHDGTELSMADFLLNFILSQDRAQTNSYEDIYDPIMVSTYDTFMANFRGIDYDVSDPEWGLIVTYYSEIRDMTGPLNVTTAYPWYSRGPGVWHTIALGILAEADGLLAFGSTKATAEEVDWMDITKGPGLTILEGKLAAASGAGYIPYEPAIRGFYEANFLDGGDKLDDEIAERYTKLAAWYAAKEHFWVAYGPFYIDEIDTTGFSIVLKRFEDYPDPVGRFNFLLDPLPEAP